MRRSAGALQPGAWVVMPASFFHHDVLLAEVSRLRPATGWESAASGSQQRLSCLLTRLQACVLACCRNPA